MRKKVNAKRGSKVKDFVRNRFGEEEFRTYLGFTPEERDSYYSHYYFHTHRGYRLKQPSEHKHMTEDLKHLMPFSKIAKRLGIAESSVHRHYKSALIKLRDYLALDENKKNTLKLYLEDL